MLYLLLKAVISIRTKKTLDDFLAEMKEFDEDVIVEITDDNASLKAYNKLINALEEIAITYTEK